MTEKKEKNSKFQESIQSLYDEDNYNKINEMLKISFESLLGLTKKGIDKAYEKWGPVKNKKPSENPALVDQRKLKGELDLIHMGMTFSIFGMIIGGSTLLPGVLDLDITLLVTGISIGGLSFVANRFMRFKKDRWIRIQKYLRELGSSTVGTLTDFSSTAGVPIPIVLKDIESYMQKDILKESRLVENNSIFILDRSTYQVYKQKSFDTKEKEELEEGTWESTLKEELATLSLRIQGLHEPLATEVKDIEAKATMIMEYGIKHPESIENYHRFSDYYLPTTNELLRRYQQFETSTTQEAQKAKREIEASIKTIDKGFTSILENINEEIRLDTKSDISVLETLMKQEGLLDKDFQQK